MNTLDIVFIVLIFVSVLYSVIRGLVREIFSFLSIILGFLGASYGYPALAGFLKGWTASETLGQILGFAILFILVAVAVGLAGRFLSRMVHKGGLGWADRMGGGAFGFLKAVLLIAIIVLVLTAFLPAKSGLLLESKVSPAALTIARGLSFLVPEKLHRLYRGKEWELKKHWAVQEFSLEKSDGKGLRKP